jgi:hypothetical protein
MEKKNFGGGRVFMATAKEAALEIPKHLSDQATWKEIMYELYGHL